MKSFATILFNALVISGLFFLSNKFLYSISVVSGPSMEPYLVEGNYILAEKKIFLKKENLTRGEIYIIEFPNSKKLIKMLVGLPGDKIWVENGKVYINGSISSPPIEAAEADPISCRFSGLYEVPEERYFFLGTSLCRSTDSRELGPVSFDAISGHFLRKIF